MRRVLIGLIFAAALAAQITLPAFRGVVAGGSIPPDPSVPSVLTANSLGYWDMRTKSDATHYADLSTYGNHAAIVGGVTARPYGAALDGVNGYLEVAAASLTPQPYETGPELVTNGTFAAYTGTPDSGSNNTITGWTQPDGANGHVEITATVPPGYVSDAQGVKLKIGTQNGILRQQITVTQGDQLGLGFWSRGDGTNAPRYSVLDHTHADANIIALTQLTNASTDYAYYSVIFTVPAGCTSIYLNLYSYGSSASWGYFSHVTLRKALGFTAGMMFRRDGDWHVARQYVMTRLLNNYGRIWHFRLPGNDQSTPGAQIGMGNADNGTSAGATPPGGTDAQVGGGDFEQGVWHYVVGVWSVGSDNRTTQTLYVDGVQVAQSATTNWYPFYPGGPDALSNAPLRIGATAATGNEHYMLGTFAAAHVNTGAFTAANVTDATTYMRSVLLNRGLTPGW